MILPGISGAYILLILGAYSTVIGLIKDAITSLSNLQMELIIPALQAFCVCFRHHLGTENFCLHPKMVV